MLNKNDQENVIKATSKVDGEVENGFPEVKFGIQFRIKIGMQFLSQDWNVI